MNLPYCTSRRYKKLYDWVNAENVMILVDYETWKKEAKLITGAIYLTASQYEISMEGKVISWLPKSATQNEFVDWCEAYDVNYILEDV